MGKIVLRITVLIGLLACATAGSGFAAVSKAVFKKAIELLKELSPTGYAVYKIAGDQEMAQWLAESDFSRDYGVTTAVHESVHAISGYRSGDMSSYKYYLPSGSYIGIPHRELFNRNEIAQYLEASEKDNYYQTYLTGSSGKQDLRLVLDELNAYTFSVIVGTEMVSLLSEGVTTSTRDGLAAFMRFTQLYLYHGRTVKKTDYAKIKADKETLKTIKTLWENAEDALLKSSPYRALGINDKQKLEILYKPENILELSLLFEASGIKVNIREKEIRESLIDGSTIYTETDEETEVSEDDESETISDDEDLPETIESDDDSQPVDTIESDDETQPDETIESDDDDETLLEPVDSDDEETTETDTTVVSGGLNQWTSASGAKIQYPAEWTKKAQDSYMMITDQTGSVIVIYQELTLPHSFKTEDFIKAFESGNGFGQDKYSLDKVKVPQSDITARGLDDTDIRTYEPKDWDSDPFFSVLYVARKKDTLYFIFQKVQHSKYEDNIEALQNMLISFTTK